MRHLFLIPLGISICSAALASSALAAPAKCPVLPAVKVPICSYAATNGSCSITLDRMNPATPPTIYVRRGCSVTVNVLNPSGLEILTLDWKASSVVVPPDTFQAVFSALSPNLGKFTNVEKSTQKAVETRCEDLGITCNDAAEISDAQKRVLGKIQDIDPISASSSTLIDIKGAMLPIPGGVTLTTQPWYDTDAWRTNVTAALNRAVGRVSDSVKIEELDRQVITLAADISAFRANAASKPDVLAKADTLDRNQALLKAAFDALFVNGNKIAALSSAIGALNTTPAGIVGSSIITDNTDSSDKNFQSQTWTLNAVNKLSAIAKRIAADKLTDASTANLTTLADQAAKQPLATVTVQFQAPSRIEVSSGLLVPLAPYHSYAKASVAAAGTITDNVVQETKTYTVVPMVFVNVLQKEWIGKNTQRSGVFYTGGVGYNPATSMVEFGAGLTYSYRSMAFSALADIGRDTKLAGGFVVGQSLGNTGNAATPLTTTHWVVKPALAISVRIPIGGGSSK